MNDKKKNYVLKFHVDSSTVKGGGSVTLETRIHWVQGPNPGRESNRVFCACLF